MEPLGTVTLKVSLTSGHEPAPSEEPSKEYYFLESLVNNANADCLEVKKWSVTAATAVAVIGQVAGISAYIELAIIAILAVAFWLTEARTRMTQWSFIRRIQQLETLHPDGPQISHSWTRFYFGRQAFDELRAAKTPEWDNDVGEAKRLGHHFWTSSTMLPHAFVLLVAVVAAIGLFAWRQYGPEPAEKPQKEALSGDVTVHLLQGNRATPAAKPAAQ